MIIESATPTPELLTVAEFADKADVTTSYIYKILSTKLADYVTTVANKKLISSEALSMFIGESNAVDNDNMEKLLNSYQLSITILQQEIELLTAQLKVKDEQLLSADSRLMESHSITMKNLNLTENQQRLLQAAIDEVEHPAPEPITIEPPRTVSKKRGIFSRIFHRDDST